jgi:hypothetical protein
MLRTHYDNLQISQTASDTVIRAAYRALSQKHHPDKDHSNRERAESNMKIINDSYAVLSDPVLRKVHDEWIMQQIRESSGPQRPSHDPNADPHSNLNSQKPPTDSTARSGVAQDSLARIVGTGAIATVIGLLALAYLALKAENLQAALLPISVAVLALAIGIPVLLYAGFAALRKKTR